MRDRHILSLRHPALLNPLLEIRQSGRPHWPKNFIVGLSDGFMLPVKLRVINPGVAQVPVLIEHSDRRMFQRHAKSFFAAPHFLFSLFALGHVAHDGLQAPVRKQFAANLTREDRSVLA